MARRRKKLKASFYVPAVIVILVIAGVLFGILFNKGDSKQAAVVETTPPAEELSAQNTEPQRIFPYLEGGKWGYKDERGTPILQALYTKAFEFSEEKAIVSIIKDGTERYGVIDKEGNYIAEPMFTEAHSYANALSAIKVGEYWGYINDSGVIVIDPRYDAAGDFSSSGLARVSANGKFGYINTKGVMVISNEFEKAQDFSEDLAVVGIKDLTGVYRYEIIESSGLTVAAIGANEATEFSQGMTAVKQQNGLYTFYNRRGNTVFDTTFNNALNFTENLAAVKVDDKWGYIDQKGAIVIEPKFEDVGQFSEGLAPAKTEGKWGYIDATGNMVIANRYDSVSSFENGYASVKQGNNICSMDAKGNYKQIYVITTDEELATQSATIRLNSGSVRLRKGPSTDTEALTVLSNGTVVQFIGQEGEWSKINYDGIIGYVKSTFLVK